MGILKNVKEEPSKNNLSPKEIEFILNTLRDCSFKGSQVVDLYHTVLKLQQQYKSLTG